MSYPLQLDASTGRVGGHQRDQSPRNNAQDSVVEVRWFLGMVHRERSSVSMLGGTSNCKADLTRSNRLDIILISAWPKSAMKGYAGGQIRSARQVSEHSWTIPCRAVVRQSSLIQVIQAVCEEAAEDKLGSVQSEGLRTV